MGPDVEETACLISNITILGGDINYPARWIPPPPDVYKANIAGAHFQEKNASGTRFSEQGRILWLLKPGSYRNKWMQMKYL